MLSSRKRFRQQIHSITCPGRIHRRQDAVSARCSYIGQNASAPQNALAGIQVKLKLFDRHWNRP
jgi:hypothetical protein